MIAILLVFCARYFAASLLVPIAAAVLLSMLLAAPVQFLQRLHVPRSLASAFVVLSVMVLLAASVTALAGPAQSWIERAPQSLQRIQEKLHAFTKPIEDIKKAIDQLAADELGKFARHRKQGRPIVTIPLEQNANTPHMHISAGLSGLRE